MILSQKKLQSGPEWILHVKFWQRERLGIEYVYTTLYYIIIDWVQTVRYFLKANYMVFHRFPTSENWFNWY